MKILHIADVHLKAAEKEYGLGLLQEIGQLIAREGVKSLLIAGDLFDSWQDLLLLREDFCGWAQGMIDSGCGILYLPGNHDVLNRKAAGRVSLDEWAALGWGSVTLMAGRPWSQYRLDSVDVLGYTPGYGDRDEDGSGQLPPEKRSSLRILMAHGTLEGRFYRGLEPEENDPLLFFPGLSRQAEADYTALGHIHRYDLFRENGSLWGYPGSATPWRRGEEGPRRAILLESTPAEDGWAASEQILEKAGAFREYSVPWETLGDPQVLSTFGEALDYGPQDLVTITCTGFARSSQEMEALLQKLHTPLRGACRRWEVSTDQVFITQGVEEESLFQEFHELWQNECGRVTPEVARRSRELALEALRDIKASRGEL